MLYIYIIYISTLQQAHISFEIGLGNLCAAEFFPPEAAYISSTKTRRCKAEKIGLQMSLHKRCNVMDVSGAEEYPRCPGCLQNICIVHFFYINNISLTSVSGQMI